MTVPVLLSIKNDRCGDKFPNACLGRNKRRFFRDSSDPKYDLFDRLVKIVAIYTSDIKWRDYPNAEKNDDEVL